MATAKFENVKITGELNVLANTMYSLWPINNDHEFTTFAHNHLNVIQVDCSEEPINIILPSISSSYWMLSIIDVYGKARTNNITISANEVDNIMGYDNVVINNDHNNIQLISDGVNSWILN